MAWRILNDWQIIGDGSVAVRYQVLVNGAQRGTALQSSFRASDKPIRLELHAQSLKIKDLSVSCSIRLTAGSSKLCFLCGAGPVGEWAPRLDLPPYQTNYADTEMSVVTQAAGREVATMERVVVENILSGQTDKFGRGSGNLPYELKLEITV